VMPYRTPVVTFALVCGVIFSLHSGAARAAEIPTVKGQANDGIIHDYLLHNPDVLIEALHGAEDKLNREADAKADKVLSDQRSEIFDDPATPVGGNPKGDVTIVEFFDTRCPYCRGMEPVMDKFLTGDHRVRLVYKDLPILGPASVLGTRALLAAQKQDAYTRMRDAVMKLPPDTTLPQIESTARGLGLDWNRMARDMNDPGVQARIDANLKLAHSLGIEGTPALIIGNALVPGAPDLQELRKAVSEARRG